MNLHKVIITLHEGTNKQGFIKDLVESSSVPFVPSRDVKLHDERFLKTLCEFFLTEEEILQLRKDVRVKGVDIKSERHLNVDSIREGTFTMVDYDSTGIHNDPSDPAYEYDPEVVKNYKQWGLLASAKKTDQPNVVGNPTPSDYIFKERTGFSADGEGVDVVIFDNGIQWAHPEFSGPPYGGSRVQLIDWWAESGVPGSQPSYYYQTNNAHGTSMASVVAGNIQGWAPKAHIYSMVLADLLPGGSGAGFPGVTTAFELILGWHKNKPNNRPTIVNMGWSRKPTCFVQQGSGGQDEAPVGTQAYENGGGGLVDINCEVGIPASCEGGKLTLRHPQIGNSAENELVEQLIKAGVIIVASTGNNNFLFAHPNDAPLYDYFIQSGELVGSDGAVNTPLYPCRGSYPGTAGGANKCITVSNAGVEAEEDGGKYYFKKHPRASFGAGIDIFAPGTNILAAVNNSAVAYGPDAILYPPADTAGIKYYLQSGSGTSYSAAQVTGILALWLQSNTVPKHLQNENMQANARQWLFRNAVEGAMWDADPATSNTVDDCCGGTTQINDCGNTTIPPYVPIPSPVVDSISSYILAGSPNRFLFNKFSKEAARIDF
jgi:hypothetical protein